MAYPYNNSLPIGYPYFAQPMAQPTQPTQQTQPIQQPIQQIRDGGFIAVRSEMEAMNYPVAPGMSVTFKNETAPYIYTKTMGFSQLDRPVFERYRLVKEEEQPKEEQATPITEYAEKDEIEAIRADIEDLKAKIEKLNGKKAKKDE